MKDTTTNQDSRRFRKSLRENRSEGRDLCFEWDLESLLLNVNEQVRETLLGKENTTWPFVSWILYGIATLAIKNPISLAISKLKTNPGKGAGGAFDRIAQMPADQFIQNLRQEISLWPPSDADWRTVFHGADSSRKRQLMDILGIAGEAVAVGDA